MAAAHLLPQLRIPGPTDAIPMESPVVIANCQWVIKASTCSSSCCANVENSNAPLDLPFSVRHRVCPAPRSSLRLAFPSLSHCSSCAPHFRDSLCVRFSLGSGRSEGESNRWVPTCLPLSLLLAIRAALLSCCSLRVDQNRVVEFSSSRFPYAQSDHTLKTKANKLRYIAAIRVKTLKTSIHQFIIRRSQSMIPIWIFSLDYQKLNHSMGIMTQN